VCGLSRRSGFGHGWWAATLEEAASAGSFGDYAAVNWATAASGSAAVIRPHRSFGFGREWPPSLRFHRTSVLTERRTTIRSRTKRRRIPEIPPCVPAAGETSVPDRCRLSLDPAALGGQGGAFPSSGCPGGRTSRFALSKRLAAGPPYAVPSIADSAAWYDRGWRLDWQDF